MLAVGVASCDMIDWDVDPVWVVIETLLCDGVCACEGESVAVGMTLPEDTCDADCDAAGAAEAVPEPPTGVWVGVAVRVTNCVCVLVTLGVGLLVGLGSTPVEACEEVTVASCEGVGGCVELCDAVAV